MDPRPPDGRLRVGIPGLGGRRASDRWLTYLFMILQVFVAVFIVWTSYEQDRAEHNRQEIARAADEQSHILSCRAYANQEFNLAITEVLLAATSTPEAPPYRQLARVRDEIRAEFALHPEPRNC